MNDYENTKELIKWLSKNHPWGKDKPIKVQEDGIIDPYEKKELNDDELRKQWGV